MSEILNQAQQFEETENDQEKDITPAEVSSYLMELDRRYYSGLLQISRSLPDDVAASYLKNVDDEFENILGYKSSEFGYFFPTEIHLEADISEMIEDHMSHSRKDEYESRDLKAEEIILLPNGTFYLIEGSKVSFNGKDVFDFGVKIYGSQAIDNESFMIYGASKVSLIKKTSDEIFVEILKAEPMKNSIDATEIYKSQILPDRSIVTIQQNPHSQQDTILFKDSQMNIYEGLEGENYDFAVLPDKRILTLNGPDIYLYKCQPDPQPDIINDLNCFILKDDSTYYELLAVSDGRVLAIGTDPNEDGQLDLLTINDEKTLSIERVGIYEGYSFDKPQWLGNNRFLISATIEKSAGPSNQETLIFEKKGPVWEHKLFSTEVAGQRNRRVQIANKDEYFEVKNIYVRKNKIVRT